MRKWQKMLTGDFWPIYRRVTHFPVDLINVSCIIISALIWRHYQHFIATTKARSVCLLFIFASNNCLEMTSQKLTEISIQYCLYIIIIANKLLVWIMWLYSTCRGQEEDGMYAKTYVIAHLFRSKSGCLHHRMRAFVDICMGNLHLCRIKEKKTHSSSSASECLHMHFIWDTLPILTICISLCRVHLKSGRLLFVHRAYSNFY